MSVKGDPTPRGASAAARVHRSSDARMLQANGRRFACTAGATRTKLTAFHVVEMPPADAFKTLLERHILPQADCVANLDDGVRRLIRGSTVRQVVGPHMDRLREIFASAAAGHASSRAKGPPQMTFAEFASCVSKRASRSSRGGDWGWSRCANFSPLRPVALPGGEEQVSRGLRAVFVHAVVGITTPDRLPIPSGAYHVHQPSGRGSSPHPCQDTRTTMLCSSPSSWRR